MSIVFERRANASTGLALEFTLQRTHRDTHTHRYTQIHVGLLHVRVHLEKSYQSTHAACFRDDNIERYRRNLATMQLGSIFCNIYFRRPMLPTFLNFTFFYSSRSSFGLMYDFCKNYVALFYSRNKS